MSTLQAFVVFAQEHGAVEETSKTPYYVAGSVLALWAVIVSAIGIIQHDFPRSAGAARGVMALSALLVAVTMAAAIITG